MSDCLEWINKGINVEFFTLDLWTLISVDTLSFHFPLNQAAFLSNVLLPVLNVTSLSVLQSRQTDWQAMFKLQRRGLCCVVGCATVTSFGDMDQLQTQSKSQDLTPSENFFMLF